MYYLVDIINNTEKRFDLYYNLMVYMCKHIDSKQINMNYKDLYHEIYCVLHSDDAESYTDKWYLRPYMVYDNYGRIIDVREDLCNTDKYMSSYKSHRRKSIYYFRYRIDPVPKTFTLKGFKKYLRSPHTTNEKRQNCREDYKPFIRGKRSNRMLPSLYDDIMRDYHSRSWKDCTKKRKQWM